MFLRPSFKGPSSVLEMDILLNVYILARARNALSKIPPSHVANHPRLLHAASEPGLVAEMIVFAVSDVKYHRLDCQGSTNCTHPCPRTR